MPLDFPTSPVLNQLYTFGGKTWKWDGAGWISYNIGLVGPYVISINGATGTISILGGTGISVSGNTGNVTITNVGVLSVNGATGAVTISPVGSTGYIQYHTGAGFSADDGLYYTSATETLTIGSGARHIEIVPGVDNFVSALGASKLRLTQSGGNEITIGDFDGTYGGNNTYLEVYDQTSTVSIFASNFNCQAATVMPFGLSASFLFVSTGATFDQYVNLKGGLQISGSSGTNGQVLTSTGSGITWATPSSGGGTKTYEVFTPLHNQPPASNYATVDTRNSIMVLEFDAATDESSVFVGVMPEAASLGSGLKVRIHWMADTATSGTCRWGVQIERMNTDEDSDSFDTVATAGSTTNGTSGIITTTEITITTIDSVAAGEPYRLKVFRDADGTSGTDDMTGDAQLVAVEVRSAS
jgi:hypothetical protein